MALEEHAGLVLIASGLTSYKQTSDQHDLSFTRTYAVVPLQTLDHRSGGPLNCG